MNSHFSLFIVNKVFRDRCRLTARVDLDQFGTFAHAQKSHRLQLARKLVAISHRAERDLMISSLINIVANANERRLLGVLDLIALVIEKLEPVHFE